MFVAILNDAAINATPTKYSQNKRHGMYDGTIISGIPPERCSAPKAANGMAKHKGVRATTLSMPRAWTISFFAAHRPITSRARPAADIEKAVLDTSKNTARIVGCMDLPSRAQRLSFYVEMGFKTASGGTLPFAGP